ncbi:MAG: hypothetical protein OK452_04225 [Thaumarchaeota archaeon]|nr:hypothetical protein [Nitrososphaerota archaeon]
MYRWPLVSVKGASAVAAVVQPADNLDDREPKLARRSPFVLSTKLCPRCLSPLEGRSKLGGWLIPQDYYCIKCGYSGSVFVEKEHESSAEHQ